MKTYSFVRETAKKILTPWNKDDTTGTRLSLEGRGGGGGGGEGGRGKEIMYHVSRPSCILCWPDGTSSWHHSPLPLLPVCTHVAVQGQVPKVRDMMRLMVDYIQLILHARNNGSINWKNVIAYAAQVS